MTAGAEAEGRRPLQRARSCRRITRTPFPRPTSSTWRGASPTALGPHGFTTSLLAGGPPIDDMLTLTSRDRARRRLQPDRRLRGIRRRGHARDRHARAGRPGLHRVPVGGALLVPLQEPRQGPAPGLGPADRPVRGDRAWGAGPRMVWPLARHRQARRRGRQPRDRPGERRRRSRSALIEQVDRLRRRYGGRGPDRGLPARARVQRRRARPSRPRAACPSPRSSTPAGGRRLADPDLRGEVGSGSSADLASRSAARRRSTSAGRVRSAGSPSRPSRRRAAATTLGSISGSTRAASR